VGQQGKARKAFPGIVSDTDRRRFDKEGTLVPSLFIQNIIYDK